MKSLVLSIVGLFLTACATPSFVNNPFAPRPQVVQSSYSSYNSSPAVASTSENSTSSSSSQGTGIGTSTVTVKYQANGFNVETRRVEAIAQAKSQCGGGRVKLLNEQMESETSGVVNMGYGNYGAVKRPYKVMTFQCIDQVAQEVIY